MYMEEIEFEDTRGVIRIRKSKKNRQHNGQKNKQRSTKLTHQAKIEQHEHHKKPEWMQVLRKDKQLLLR